MPVTGGGTAAKKGIERTRSGSIGSGASGGLKSPNAEAHLLSGLLVSPEGGEVKKVSKEKWSEVLQAQGLATKTSDLEEGPASKKKPWVDDSRFDVAIGLVIVVNAITIGLQTDLDKEGTDNTVWIVLENVFCVVWVFEMLARMYFVKLRYFCNGWNRLDFFLVCLSVSDAWIMPFVFSDSNALSQFGVLRVIRIARMLRLLRLIRLVRMFKELWLIVNGFIEALRTLGWVLMLLTIVIYCGSIYMTMIVGQTCHSDYKDFVDCFKYFGRVDLSMYTLFQVLTLDSWSSSIARPVLEVKPYLFVFFLVFLFLTTFGLLNIVVGVIVENTLNEASKNVKLQAERMEKQLRRELEALRNLFEAADKDGSGEVDLEEFRNIMQQKDVRQIFQLMELPHNEPDTLFDIFDDEKRGVLTVESFVEGAMKLKGPPTGFDMRSMTVAVRGIAVRVARIEDQVEDCVDAIKKQPFNSQSSSSMPNGKGGQEKCSNNGSSTVDSTHEHVVPHGGEKLEALELPLSEPPSSAAGEAFTWLRRRLEGLERGQDAILGAQQISLLAMTELLQKRGGSRSQVSTARGAPGKFEQALQVSPLRLADSPRQPNDGANSSTGKDFSTDRDVLLRRLKAQHELLSQSLGCLEQVGNLCPGGNRNPSPLSMTSPSVLPPQIPERMSENLSQRTDQL